MKTTVMALVSFALAGCATIKLDGSINVCAAPSRQNAQAGASSSTPTDNLSVLVRTLHPARRERAKASPGLLAASVGRPSTSRIPDEITSEDIDLGHAFATKQLPRELAANLAESAGASEDDVPSLLPWLHELPGPDSALRQRVKEANEARKQINVLWSKSPGLSSNARSISLIDGRGAYQVEESFGVFSREDAELARRLGETVIAGGYDALALGTAGKLSALLGSPTKSIDALGAEDQARAQQLLQQLNTSRFISVYARAYFRAGHLVQASLDVDELVKTFGDRIKASLPHLTDAQRKALDPARPWRIPVVIPRGM